MKKLFFFLFLFLLLTGCSNKISLNEYGHYNAPKSEFQPSESDLHKKYRVIVTVDETDRNYIFLSRAAADSIKAVLSSYKPVVVLNRKFKSIKEEIKLYEEAKNAQIDLNQADFIIFTEIDDAQTKSVYIPRRVWRDKKGRVYVNPAYYINKACVRGNIEIVKIPENKVVQNIPLYACVSENSSYRTVNYKNLLLRAVERAVGYQKDNLYKLFSVKGYVYEVRKNEDSTILHVTVGRNDGVREGMKVGIYTIKKRIEPFSGKVKTETVKIGEGEISNIINSEDSWVIVDKVKEEVKIGDFVKPLYEKESSFIF